MRGLAALVASAALVACAPLPPQAPDGPPPHAEPRPAPKPDASPRQAALSRHAALARAARESGDLALAAEHHAVLALIDPGNPAHRNALRDVEAQIDAAVRERLRAGSAARKAGDAARAREAWLRALALDPDNAEAARALRELEQQAMARTQADRAARARSMEDVIANVRARAAVADNAADLEQRLELVRSSDASIAVREARAWAEANPGDRTGRQRLATALADRGRAVEAKGEREWALALYDEATTLGGSTQAEAGKRASSLRRTLADEAYADGMRARSTDLTVAIRHWEAALKLDPNHPRARARLREARAAQQKLERITK